MDLYPQTTGPQESLQDMDILSQAWCSSAIQVFQPAAHDESLVSKENAMSIFENDRIITSSMNNKNSNLDNGDHKSMPPWKHDDLKSWIWLQQAIHPELDYDRCFRKRELSRKIVPWKPTSIKKWVKEMKQRRKEEERLRKAEVHAAISVAGVAAALAAVASENAELNQSKTSKENLVASAAALVAAQCAQAAEAAGAKREQLTATMSAAMTATDASDILTLTAAAATSLRGAATLRGRPGRKERASRGELTLPSDEFEFNFKKCRASLAKGTELCVVKFDGSCGVRLVSIVLNRDATVILKIKKINAWMPFSSAKESIVFDLHTSQEDEPIREAESSNTIVMTTSRGIIKLMTKNFVCYRIWTTTINHMLMLSTTFSKYELQFCRD